MRRFYIFLTLIVLGTGCASLGDWYNSREEFVLEVTGYKLWREMYYLDGRTEVQWLFVCKTLSPKSRTARETDIVVSDRHPLFNCPTGTVLRCQFNRKAIATWESVAKRESAKVNIKDLQSKVQELERNIASLERVSGGSATSLAAALGARDELEAARSSLLQAELYSKAIVVKTSDIVGYEEVTKKSGVAAQE
ncbi:MAG: hypothetical protein WCL44_03780 [bacterium]